MGIHQALEAAMERHCLTAVIGTERQRHPVLMDVRTQSVASVYDLTGRDRRLTQYAYMRSFGTGALTPSFQGSDLAGWSLVQWVRQQLACQLETRQRVVLICDDCDGMTGAGRQAVELLHGGHPPLFAAVCAGGARFRALLEGTCSAGRWLVLPLDGHGRVPVPRFPEPIVGGAKRSTGGRLTRIDIERAVHHLEKTHLTAVPVSGGTTE